MKPNLIIELKAVLLEAGSEGLPLKLIVRNVFNRSNSLFEPIDYKEVKTDIVKYLRKAVKGANPNILKSSNGNYVFNQLNDTSIQLYIDFNHPIESTESQSKISTDQSLSLF